MEIDLSNKCRVCLNEDDQKRDIFVEFEHGITLQEILRSTTNFEIAKDDGLSPFMCHSCTNIVIDFYNFKNIYQANESQIRALLAANVETTKDVPRETDRDKEEFAVQENTEPTLKEIKLEICPDSDKRNCEYETGYHSETTTHDCPNCDESLLNENVLEHHLKNTHVDDIRKNSANSSVEISDQPATTSVETVNSKKYSRASARSKIKIQEDVEYWGDSRILCHICNSSFKRRCDLKEHMDVHLDKRIHVCEICQKTFKRRTVLAKHRQLHTKKKTVIPQNSANAETDDEFETTTTHIEAENSTETFCKICNKSFDSHQLYKKHAKCHNAHICHVCGSKFKRKFDLKEHINVHLDKRIHVCEFCNKTFKQKAVLIHHRRIHTHPREQLCMFCGKAFTTKGTLTTHINLCHVKSRNYVCVICNARFSLKGTLDKHVKRHQERQNEFQCKQCPAAYKDSSSLSRHVLERHNEAFVKPSCNECHKNYASAGSLARHMKNVHGRIIDSTSDLRDGSGDISKDDGLSPFMCHSCTNVVIDFYNFKNIYQANEKQIKALLATNFAVIKDVSEETDIESGELAMQENTDSASEEIKLEIYVDSDDENHESETDCDTEKILHSCPHCDESFLSEEDLEHHLKNTHVGDPPATNVPINCKTNNRAFARNKVSKEHLEYWDKPPNVCHICSSSFTRNFDLKEHMDVHLDRKIHVCEICKKAFKRRTVLARHRRLHTKKIMSSQGLASAEIHDDFIAATTHVKEEDPTETFCKICNKSFDSHKVYKEHARCHNTHICHVCGSKFKRKSDLKEHMDVHLDKRIHVCEFCQKTFKRKGVLMHHRRIHTHPREQLCTFCGKAFNAKSTLRTHIKLCHVKGRDFVCVICNARFPLKGTLDKHVKRHQERQNEFRCKECPAAYKDSSSLNRHVFERHNETFVKPSCDMCHKKYSSVANLTRHVKNVHVENVLERMMDPDLEEKPLVICI